MANLQHKPDDRTLETLGRLVDEHVSEIINIYCMVHNIKRDDVTFDTLHPPDNNEAQTAFVEAMETLWNSLQYTYK